eukprot:gene24343-40211_t
MLSGCTDAQTSADGCQMPCLSSSRPFDLAAHFTLGCEGDEGRALWQRSPALPPAPSVAPQRS